MPKKGAAFAHLSPRTSLFAFIAAKPPKYSPEAQPPLSDRSTEAARPRRRKGGAPAYAPTLIARVHLGEYDDPYAEDAAADAPRR